MSADTDDNARKINRALSSDDVLENYIKRFTGGLTAMPNNICNARCVFCAYPQNPDPKTTMSLELFKRALDDAFEIASVGTLSLTPMAGDPLADPTLFDKIEYAKSKGVQLITFNTNGILLGRKDIYRRILDVGLDHVGISTPGFDPAQYKAIFGVDRCDQLVDGLVKLGEYKRAKGKSCQTTVDIAVYFGAVSDETMQLPQWQKVRPFFDDGTFTLNGWDSVQQMVDSQRSTDGRNRTVSATVDSWSETIGRDDLPDNLELKEVTHTTSDPPCWRLLEDAAVLPDGKVRVCSCRYQKTSFDELVIGDLNQQPLAEILYGDQHKKLISDVARGHWPTVCKTCTLYKAFEMSEAERDFLSAKSVDEQNGGEGTNPINSSASLAARARGKLELAKAVFAAAEYDRAFNHLHGALSYSVELSRRDPANKGYLSLLADTHRGLGDTLSAKNETVGAEQHYAAARAITAQL